MAIKFVDESDITTVADAIRAKGGTAAQLVFPSGMAAAVAAIQTGAALPVLTHPTENYFVLAGFEYIDGTGTKKTGTMPVMPETDLAVQHENGMLFISPGMDGFVTGEAHGVVSAASLDANLIAGNIRQGVSIFGVAGTCKRITTESGTWTAPSDTNMADIQCTAGAKCIVIDAPASMYSGAKSANTIFSACAALIPTDALDGLDTMFCVTASVNASGDFQNTMGKITRSNGISIGTSSMVMKYVAGAVYTWAAYYWED